VEFLGGLTAYLSVVNFGVSPTAVLVFIFCCALIVISFIDYDFYIIPNVISLPGTALGAAVGLSNQYLHIFTYPVVSNIVESAWGFLAGAGFLFIVSEGYMRFRKKEGLGMGDVKLLAMIGVFFGVAGALSTIFIGSLIGAVVGTIFVVCRGRGFSHPLPFGPSLALAAYLYIFLGEEIIGFLAGGPYMAPAM
jgi:leader peptidase (prepilin peptidase)/N-methyltransferase